MIEIWDKFFVEPTYTLISLYYEEHDSLFLFLSGSHNNLWCVKKKDFI